MRKYLNMQNLVAISLVVVLFASLGYIKPYYAGGSFPAFVLRPFSVTIPVDSGSTPSGVATYTVASLTKASYDLTTADTDGARFYVGETGDIKNGMLTTMFNVGTNTITLTEVSGVLELNAATIALGQYDGVVIKRLSDRWVLVSSVNN